MAPIGIEPRWIGQGSERRFAVLHRPLMQTPRALLFVPAFAEEMNKSRRMVARTARALAASGCAVLVLDLHGCGDSPGRLEEASWAGWCEDVQRAHAWLAEHLCVPIGLWAMRAGALLAASTLPALGRISQLVLWQPALSGKAQLTQFLRLKVAGDALVGGDAATSTSTAALWSELQRGVALDIAGYRLPPAVAVPMAAAELTAPIQADRAVWLEVGAGDDASPAAQRTVAAWQSAGVAAEVAAVSGPPFWQTQELEDCPALVAATVAHAVR